jgi:hypothetical protein
MDPEKAVISQQKLSVYGKTPPKLWSFLVQIVPTRRENFSIDAYTDVTIIDKPLFREPACALACECENENQAMKLVADIHYAMIGYLTHRVRRKQLHINDKLEKAQTEQAWKILNELERIMTIIIEKTDIRARMLESETLRPFYEELADILEDAGRLRRLHTVDFADLKEAGPAMEEEEANCGDDPQSVQVGDPRA